MLERFKKAIKQAEDAGQTEFNFDGHEFHVGYAKYLCEYLEGRLPK